MKRLERASYEPVELESAITDCLNMLKRSPELLLAYGLTPAATEAEIRKKIEPVIRDETENAQVWVNDVYQVHVRRRPCNVVHLSIKRIDREPVTDWMDKQAIKNQLVGEECEGVELYPAESRLVNTSNQFHLFCVDDTTFRFPLGFSAGRVVSDYTEGKAKQRKPR